MRLSLISFRLPIMMRHVLYVASLFMCPMLVSAQVSLQLTSLTERSGPNAQFGAPFANGFADYFQLLNRRDGGIGGARIAVEECEIGRYAASYEQCYDSANKHRSLAISSRSADNAHTLTQKTNADQIPYLSAGQGLSAAAMGQYFPWTFVYPTTPWSQLSAILSYINSVSDLRRQKIGFLYPDTQYGKKPLALLNVLSKEFAFDIAQYPTRVEDVLDQSLQWFHIRKTQPDWIIIWGDSAMSEAAIRNALKIRFPKDRLIGNALSASYGESSSILKKANGYLAVNYTALGQDFPALQQLIEKVVKTGNSQVESPVNVGSASYNQGVLSAVILAEAIEVAQSKTGNVNITASDLRYGLENIQLNKARLTALGLSGFSAEIVGSCTNHEGGGAVYVQQWNGRDWERRSKYIEPLHSFAVTSLEQAALAFIAENPGWERQTCP